MDPTFMHKIDYLGLIRHKNLLYQGTGIIGEAFFQMGNKLLALCYLNLQKSKQAGGQPSSD